MTEKEKLKRKLLLKIAQKTPNLAESLLDMPCEVYHLEKEKEKLIKALNELMPKKRLKVYFYKEYAFIFIAGDQSCRNKKKCSF